MIKAEKGEDAVFETCVGLRTDGRAVDIDGDYTETLARIDANANGIGVFGLAFYENNTDKLKVATMSDVVPSTESIASGEYPVSRPLFFYIKKAHIGVIPGLKEYAEFFVSDDLAGPDGPLAQYGLVSDPELADYPGHGRCRRDHVSLDDRGAAKAAPHPRHPKVTVLLSQTPA